MTTQKYKPVIVLDDDLSKYKDSLEQLGFMIIFLKESPLHPTGISGIRNDAEELERILCGRTFLTSNPASLEARQIKLNFDMVVVPNQADPKATSNIIADEIQKRGLWKVQSCWRLNIDHTGKAEFTKLETD